jgi:ribose transport system permease protein
LQSEVKVDQSLAEETKPAGNVLKSAGSWLFQTQEGILLLIVLGLCVMLTIQSPVFLTGRNIGVLLSQISMTAIAAVGMTALIIVGEVDLSVGSLQAFIGVVTMQFLNQTGNLPIALALGLGLGALIGLINGLLTLGLGISSFIVTLGMLGILRGLSYASTSAAVQNTSNLPAFSEIGNGFIGFIPWPVAIMVFIFLIFYLLLNRTTLGRYIYATGGNRTAARLAGLQVNKLKLLCFVLASTLASLSAIILISRLNSGQNNAGFGFELQVVGAVLLGGTSLEGGRGSLTGTFLAVLLLGVLNNGIVLVNINSSWQTAMNGLVILLAIFLDARRRRKTGEA